jgi:hypothetical protein
VDAKIHKNTAFAVLFMEFTLDSPRQAYGDTESMRLDHVFGWRLELA